MSIFQCPLLQCSKFPLRGNLVEGFIPGSNLFRAPVTLLVAGSATMRPRTALLRSTPVTPLAGSHGSYGTPQGGVPGYSWPPSLALSECPRHRGARIILVLYIARGRRHDALFILILSSPAMSARAGQRKPKVEPEHADIQKCYPLVPNALSSLRIKSG